MPFIDWIPIVSQLKSLVQLVSGDTEGAKRTQKNFLRECPGVSQLTSEVQSATGHREAAIETKKRRIRTVNNVLNGIPLIGHLKGHRHHVTGNYKRRNQAWNAATRSAVVLYGYSVAADAVSEGICAILLAIVAGAIYDVAASLIFSEVQGIVAAFKNADDNPSAGAIFDLVAMLVGNGLLAGYGVCGMLTYETDGDARQVAYQNNRRPKETSNYYSPRVIRQEYFTAWFVHILNSLFSFLIAIVTKYNRRRKRKDKENDKQKKLKRMEELDKQKPQGYLRDKYPDSIETSLDDLTLLLRHFKKYQNLDPNWSPKLKEVVLQLLSRSWLFFTTPIEFPYTVVTQLNSERHGVHHSFIRHINQWSEVISFDNTLIRRISPLKTEIKNLTDAVENHEIVKARIEFEEARSKLGRPVPYYDVQTALLEIQMSLHRFIQENMTFDNCLGRTINDNDHKQLYFKVMTKQRKPKVMVVCISDQLYEPETTLPIRTLVTVFFKSWENFKTWDLL